MCIIPFNLTKFHILLVHTYLPNHVAGIALLRKANCCFFKPNFIVNVTPLNMFHILGITKIQFKFMREKTFNYLHT